MQIQPIKTSEDYEKALALIDERMDAKTGSDVGDELDILVTLVEAYEKKHFAVDMPDPIEALKFRMEQENLTRKDLEPIIGARGRVSEVLAKKRSLTLSMIRNLHQKLGIPARILIRPYDLI
ncbi:MAG: hypothetical protein ABFQ95_02805 [Pseudomonadota bacterium]